MTEGMGDSILAYSLRIPQILHQLRGPYTYRVRYLCTLERGSTCFKRSYLNQIRSIVQLQWARINDERFLLLRVSHLAPGMGQYSGQHC